MNNLFYRKRFFRPLVLSVLSLLLLLVVAGAHSGGTDASGGHTNSATGEYHYHHGYPAHDHEDLDGDGDLDCPYDFVDQTGDTSGSSGGGGTEATAETEVRLIEVLTVPWWVRPLLICAGAVVLLCLYQVYREKRRASDTIRRLQIEADRQRNYYADCLRETKEKHALALREQTEANAGLVEKAVQRERNTTKRELNDLIWALRKKYGVRWLYDLSGAPDGCVVVPETNLPSDTPVPAHGWGQRFTFFVNENTRTAQKKYHRARCKYAAGATEINAYTIEKNPDKYAPCTKCSPELPDMRWVGVYVRRKSFLEKYVPSKITPLGLLAHEMPMTEEEKMAATGQAEELFQELMELQKRKEQRPIKSAPAPVSDK